MEITECIDAVCKTLWQIDVYIGLYIILISCFAGMPVGGRNVSLVEGVSFVFMAERHYKSPFI